MAERLIENLRTSERLSTTINEVLTRSVAVDGDGHRQIFPDVKGLEKLMEQRRIRLYLGIDPTSPELHIGHTVPLRKLRQFQDLGHEVILLFGTFTGKIGDPSDKSATRVRLTDEQIASNLRTYAEQAGRILDLSKNAKNPISVRFNHEWLSPLTFEQIIDLSANFTVQQMQARSSFRKRIEEGKPISLHEFLYPLMQGFDSVAMDVDLEIGGKDQIPNMMDGRTLINVYKNHEKWVMGTKLIEDPSGKKMGKTEGNMMNINDWPEVKYEGIMTWPDTAIPLGFEVITSVPTEMVHQISEMLRENKVHPMEAKEALAFRVVAELDGLDNAKYAQEEFGRVKRKGELPRRMKEVKAVRGVTISDLLVLSGLASDKSEAASKIAQGAVHVNGLVVKGDTTWAGKTDGIIQIGKKTIRDIRRIVTR